MNNKPKPESKFKSILKSILIGIGIVWLSSCALFMLAAAVSGLVESALGIEPARTIVVGETKLRTATTKPFIKPTLTVAPTTHNPVVAVSEATPTATPTEARDLNQEYKEQIALYMELAIFDLEDFIDLNHQMTENPYLVFDDSWVNRVYVSLDNIQHYFDLMARTSPPPDMIGVHSWVQKLPGEMQLFSEKYKRGVDLVDADLIEASLVHLENMTGYINNITAEAAWRR